MTASEVLAGERLWSVEKADVLAFLASLPDDSLDLVFGSPPYEKARLYLEDGKDLGVARDTEAWVAWMVEITRAAVRVCKGLVAWVVEGQQEDFSYSCSPFLLMADLRRAGFNLRKPGVFRRNGIPGSGHDYFRNDWEPVVCVTRPGRLPWSDPTATGHPPKWGPGGEMSHRLTDGTRVNQWGATGERSGGRVKRRGGERPEPGSPSGKVFVKRGAVSGHKDGDTAQEGVYVPPAVANPGNVTQQTYAAEEVAALLAEAGDVTDCKVGGGQMGNRLCHDNEAPFPESLAEKYVRTFCPPGGIVCDPFSGSGTTAAVSVRLGRRFVGCDLRESQVQLARRRVEAETLPLFPEA